MRNLLAIVFFVLAAGFTPPSDLTISYSISVRTKKDNAGIAEVYNGGIQTFFSGASRARLRLASLMRIESIFASFDDGQLKKVVVDEESGGNKKQTGYNSNEWKAYNSKYSNASYQFMDDTAVILKHVCRKVIISLKDGRQITAWYYTDTPLSAFSSLLPAFSGVPGLVLKYEYTYKRKTLVYTAVAISHDPISPEVFTVPGH